MELGRISGIGPAGRHEDRVLRGQIRIAVIVQVEHDPFGCVLDAPVEFEKPFVKRRKLPGAVAVEDHSPDPAWTPSSAAEASP